MTAKQARQRLEQPDEGMNAADWFNRQSFHQHAPQPGVGCYGVDRVWAKHEAERAKWRSYSSHDGTRWRYYAQHVETGEVVETDEIGVPL